MIKIEYKLCQFIAQYYEHVQENEVQGIKIGNAFLLALDSFQKSRLFGTSTKQSIVKLYDVYKPIQGLYWLTVY